MRPQGIAVRTSYAQRLNRLAMLQASPRSIGVALKDEEDLAYVSGRLDVMIAESVA